MSTLATGFDGKSDAELIALVRTGTLAAYGTLYERHVNAALKLAHRLTGSSMAADELVSEAFAKVLDSMRAGGGPDDAFRTHLLTTVRRTATAKYGTAQFAAGDPDGAPAGLDQTLTAQAFNRLPGRLQAVLWHTEIERQPPGDVAPLLGVSTDGVPLLAQRARDALKQNYLRVHLEPTSAERCRVVSDRLLAWSRAGLSRRERAQVELHLDECATCRGLATELAGADRALRTVVPRIVLGAAAADYLKSVRSGDRAATAQTGAAPAPHQSAGITLAGIAIAAAIATALAAGGGSSVPEAGPTSLPTLDAPMPELPSPAVEPPAPSVLPPVDAAEPDPSDASTPATVLPPVDAAEPDPSDASTPATVLPPSDLPLPSSPAPEEPSSIEPNSPDNTAPAAPSPDTPATDTPGSTSPAPIAPAPESPADTPGSDTPDSPATDPPTPVTPPSEGPGGSPSTETPAPTARPPDHPTALRPGAPGALPPGQIPGVGPEPPKQVVVDPTAIELRPGRPVALAITIRNEGGTATPTVTVALTLPGGVFSAGPECPAGEGTVTCAHSHGLAPGEQTALTFRLIAAPGAVSGQLTGTVTMEGFAPAPLTVPLSVTQAPGAAPSPQQPAPPPQSTPGDRPAPPPSGGPHPPIGVTQAPSPGPAPRGRPPQ